MKAVKYICCFVICITLSGCRMGDDAIKKKLAKTSVFSWEEKYLYMEQEDKLCTALASLNCKVIYQKIPEDLEKDILISFMERRKKREEEVYYLTGTPRWGKSQGRGEMLRAVEKVVRWNTEQGKRLSYAGIVFDVEPYLLEEWDEDKNQIMKEYVDNCIAVYENASKEGIPVILCIPNFYDKKGLQTELQRLIKLGCDGVAVMNYNKSDEAGQIKEEVMLAEKYKKTILNITELQKPGLHDLTEKNTYYYDGIEGVRESWKQLKKKYDYPYMGYSWHYIKPALELLEKE